ncbi:glutathione synthetase [Babesia caballi]|uniref:glutathione synthase n=1 Tax=Babesia caballi TaxID=5871 RepID=A0AAV4M2K6_BABCB|nr:glutathione synthetase [Babesia caballi]
MENRKFFPTVCNSETGNNVFMSAEGGHSMSIYYVDQPSRRFKIRVPVRLEVAREDGSYAFPHITGRLLDIMRLIPAGSVARPPEYSGIYKCDAPETCDALEQLLRSFVRKLYALGCMTQPQCTPATCATGSVVPFSGKVGAFSTLLFPVPYPLSPFITAVRFQPNFVRLFDHVSRNVRWLCTVLEPLREVDPFMGRLLDICHRVYLSGKRRLHDDIRAYVTRGDYLLDVVPQQNTPSDMTSQVRVDHCRACHYDICLCELRSVVGGAIGHRRDTVKAFDLLPGVSLRMVEMNTIACSLSHAAELVSRAHVDCVEGVLRQRLSMGTMDYRGLTAAFRKLHLQNTPLGGIIDALAMAHEHYVKRHCSLIDDMPPCVLQVVTEDFANFFDVFAVADALSENYGIAVKVATMRELCEWRRDGRLFLRPSSDALTRVMNSKRNFDPKAEAEPGRLFFAVPPLNGSIKNEVIVNEVSVVYYRCCYSADQMAVDRDCWDVRLLCELSEAVKVPSVPTQLAGCKRVQMLLSDPASAAQLSPEESATQEASPSGAVVTNLSDTLAAFRNANVQQVDPSLEVNDAVVHEAIARPANFVLKSQTEGGAELFVHEEMAEVLRAGLERGRGELAKYVLMRRINPPVQNAAFVRGAEDNSFSLRVDRAITEVGVYGCAVFSARRVLMEECSGYLARTKMESVKIGGLRSRRFVRYFTIRLKEVKLS